MPRMSDWIWLILEDVHCSRYFFHPGVTKMNHALRHHYWQSIMRQER